MDAKVCAECGTPFYRQPHRSNQQWEKQKCCSTGCRVKALKGKPKRPILDRFWEKLNRRGSENCWIWGGNRTVRDGGYGRFFAEGHMVLAHRFAYELLVGPIPEGLTLDHLCRNRLCVNPAHLEPVTMAENSRRGIGFPGVNARKTHCPRGHPYSGSNLRVGKRSRYCRTCQRLRKIEKRDEINARRRVRWATRKAKANAQRRERYAAREANG